MQLEAFAQGDCIEEVRRVGGMKGACNSFN